MSLVILHVLVELSFSPEPKPARTGQALSRSEQELVHLGSHSGTPLWIPKLVSKQKIIIFTTKFRDFIFDSKMESKPVHYLNGIFASTLALGLLKAHAGASFYCPLFIHWFRHRHDQLFRVGPVRNSPRREETRARARIKTDLFSYAIPI